MNEKVSWLIRIWDDADPGRTGIGECGPLPGLSIDDTPDYESQLSNVLRQIQRYQDASALLGDLPKLISPQWPSILFGVETAVLDLMHGGKRVIFENRFIHGEPIDINGLIWMGDADFMRKQISDKISQGYTCLKLKVGALYFESECEVIADIRNQFGDSLTIRLDANGSFRPDDAMSRLDALSKYGIHSIEQPLMPGDPMLAGVCRDSPIPIALDEELISQTSISSRKDLLQRIRPQFIILKPSLHGGFEGCRQWIRLAEETGTGWWITSALESNIGLNAICQFTAGYEVTLPQGLGTGSIYTNNIESPLIVRHGQIMLDAQKKWEDIQDALT